MMTTAFWKSTVRPLPSVSRPSSSSCSSTFSTSGCAFSISSKSTTAYGPPPHRLGELAGLVVADVAGRRADQPRDRVLLLVLGHVDADHRVLVVEQELGQRPRQLGLADAGRAQEDEAAERAAADPAGRRGRGGWRWPRRGSPRPGRRRAGAAASSIWRSFCTSPSISRLTGMPVHLPTTSAMSSSSTSSLSSRGPLPARRPAVLRLDLRFELRDAAVLQLGRPGVVAVPLRRPRRRGAAPSSSSLRSALCWIASFSCVPVRRQRALLLLEVGQLLLELRQPLGRGLVGLLAQRLALDLELHHAPLHLVELGRHRVDLHAQPRRRLVDQVDGLVGQEAVGDVAVREHGRRDQRRVLEAAPCGAARSARAARAGC